MSQYKNLSALQDSITFSIQHLGNLTKSAFQMYPASWSEL